MRKAVAEEQHVVEESPETAEAGRRSPTCEIAEQSRRAAEEARRCAEVAREASEAATRCRSGRAQRRKNRVRPPKRPEGSPRT